MCVCVCVCVCVCACVRVCVCVCVLLHKMFTVGEEEGKCSYCSVHRILYQCVNMREREARDRWSVLETRRGTCCVVRLLPDQFNTDLRTFCPNWTIRYSLPVTVRSSSSLRLSKWHNSKLTLIIAYLPYRLSFLSLLRNIVCRHQFTKC